jgi:hypothetical protein
VEGKNTEPRHARTLPLYMSAIARRMAFIRLAMDADFLRQFPHRPVNR